MNNKSAFFFFLISRFVFAAFLKEVRLNRRSRWAADLGTLTQNILPSEPSTIKTS